jgi:hypothetical protein
VLAEGRSVAVMVTLEVIVKLGMGSIVGVAG